MKILFLIISCFFLNGGCSLGTMQKSKNVICMESNKEGDSTVALNNPSSGNFQNTSINIKTKEASNIINYLPKNYSTKGDIDYTEYLQKALDENLQITMPDFPIAIHNKGLKIPSNRIVIFQKNSILTILPNDQPKYQALLISHVQNVKIINPNLMGDRDLHMNNVGEWGMGINILSSSNISIINAHIKNFWGDGIYIGRTSNGQTYCNMIKILGGILHNNRRNGISVISGKDILIENVDIKDTQGTNPMAGIDLEPNLSDEYLYNIKLKNIRTINNKNDGIKVVFHKFTNENNVLIAIDHHTDEGSLNPLTLVGVDNLNTGSFTGLLSYTNAKWDNRKSNIKVQRMLSANLKFTIGNVNINGKKINKSINH